MFSFRKQFFSALNGKNRSGCAPRPVIFAPVFMPAPVALRLPFVSVLRVFFVSVLRVLFVSFFAPFSCRFRVKSRAPGRRVFQIARPFSCPLRVLAWRDFCTPSGNDSSFLIYPILYSEKFTLSFYPVSFVLFRHFHHAFFFVFFHLIGFHL